MARKKTVDSKRKKVFSEQNQQIKSLKTLTGKNSKKQKEKQRKMAI